MHLTRDGKLARTDIWREGKYLDLWSVPHFLSGMMVALGLYLLNFSGVSAFIIALLLLIIYELFEVIAKIEETRLNSFIDIVVGMTSFTPTFLLSSFFSYTDLVLVLVCISVINGILSFFGWRASYKAAVLEEALRKQFELGREKLKEREERLKKQLKVQSGRMRKSWYERRKKVRAYLPGDITHEGGGFA